MKRCIVIGGSGTVGSSLVRALLAADARVGFTYCNGRDVAAELEGLGALPVPLDLLDDAAISPTIAALAERLGGLDALVCCAAIPSTAEPPSFDALEDVTLDGWRRLMAVNVTGAFEAARGAAAQLPNGGNIVLLGSVDGVKPIPTPVPYAVSKAALRGLVLSLAKALGPKNIRVNLVAPGILEAGASRVVPEDLRAEYLKHSALKRYGKIEETTGLLRWLALDNTYVTGQTLLLDGGL